MSIEVVTNYLLGSTVWVLAYVADMATALDPDPDVTSITITITNPSGTAKVTTQAMSKNTSLTDANYDVYEYFYTPDSVGDWTGVVWVTDGTGGTARVSSGEFDFKVR
ncbi:MAG: hypothetical protein WC455_21605 [Dehalococcoidia bacterium]|jgi:hypothetical protein